MTLLYRDEGRHEFTLTFGQIQADMRDVSFYFRKKSGFPKLSDSGIADVLLGGHGLTVTARVASSGKDRSSVFHVRVPIAYHNVPLTIESMSGQRRTRQGRHAQVQHPGQQA